MEALVIDSCKWTLLYLTANELNIIVKESSVDSQISYICHILQILHNAVCRNSGSIHSFAIIYERFKWIRLPGNDLIMMGHLSRQTRERVGTREVARVGYKEIRDSHCTWGTRELQLVDDDDRLHRT